MELITTFIDFFLNLDKHLDLIIQNYGFWTHFILFAIIFCETGLVVTPFLPGDSLLFAAGAFAGLGSLNVFLVYFLLLAATFLGDNVNYFIGRFAGPKVFSKEKSIFFNKRYLEKTHQFYDKHGPKTIIIARFMPIIRTFAPFVAGIARMPYSRFISYSIFGSFLWNTIFIFGGYFFGNLETVKRNFSLVILAIILISILPPIIEYIKHKIKTSKKLEIK